MKSQPLEAPQSRTLEASDVPSLSKEQWLQLYKDYAAFTKDGEDFLVFDYLSALKKWQSGDQTPLVLFVLQWAGFVLVQQKLAGEDDEFAFQELPAFKAWQETLLGITEVSATFQKYEENPMAMQIELLNPKNTLDEGAQQLILLLQSVTKE